MKGSTWQSKLGPQPRDIARPGDNTALKNVVRGATSLRPESRSERWQRSVSFR